MQYPSFPGDGYPLASTVSLLNRCWFPHVFIRTVSSFVAFPERRTDELFGQYMVHFSPWQRTICVVGHRSIGEIFC